MTYSTTYFPQPRYFEYMVIADFKTGKFYQLVPKTNFVSKEFERHWHWVQYDKDRIDNTVTEHINNNDIHFADIQEKTRSLKSIKALKIAMIGL